MQVEQIVWMRQSFLGMKVENQNFIQEEIKKTLKSEMCKHKH
jgi:hypothetical protein